MPKCQRHREAGNRHQPGLRKLRISGDAGPGSDFGARIQEVLLLADFLEAVEKGHVERTVGIGLALQIAQLHLRPTAWNGLLRDLAELLLEVALLAAGEGDLTLEPADGGAYLALEPLGEILLLDVDRVPSGIELNDLAVLLAVLHPQHGFLAMQFRLLPAHFGKAWKRQHGSDSVQPGAPLAKPLHPVEELLLLDPLCARPREFRPAPHLLLPRRCDAGQAMPLLEVHDGALGLEDSLAQVADPPLEPVNRLDHRLPFDLELVLHIEIGHGISDLGRLARVARRRLDQDDVASSGLDL